MGATFCDNFMPLQGLHVRICVYIALMMLTWLGRLAMPIPSKEGVEVADIVDEGSEQNVSSNGDGYKNLKNGLEVVLFAFICPVANEIH